MKYWIGLLSLLIHLGVASQNNLSEEFNISASIAYELEEEGFQNIDIRQVDNGLVIGYENRVYRFSPLGLKRVIQISNDLLNKKSHRIEQLTFITKRHNIPEVSATWRLADSIKNSLSNISFSRKVEAWREGTSLITNQNTGNFRAELVVRPFLTMEVGNLYIEDQFIHLIDLRPKLNLYLWKGAHFTYEFVLPISNEFKTQAPHWSVIRPRVVSLTQQVRLPNSIFLNTSVGLFSRDRYGVSTQVGKYFLKDRLWLIAKIGYTGHASFVRFNGFEVKKGWAVTNKLHADYKVGIHYWLPKWNIQVSIEYGEVLSNRKALFVKCMQKFKEVDVSFFLYSTDEGRNYGMELGIPIFPKKYHKPKLFSVRPSTHFRYSYLSGFDDTGYVNLAREYQSQGMFGDLPQDLNPYFLKNYILGK